MERVGFGPRFLAALIDLVAMLIVLTILGTVFGVSALGAGMGMSAEAGVVGFSIAAVIMAAIPLAYSSTEIFQAATPGKQVMKLKIKNQDGTDATQSVLQKRWAVKYSGSLISLVGTITTIGIFMTVGGLVGLVIGLGCFLILTEGKQTLHDKLAETAVFKIS